MAWRPEYSLKPLHHMRQPSMPLCWLLAKHKLDLLSVFPFQRAPVDGLSAGFGFIQEVACDLQFQRMLAAYAPHPLTLRRREGTVGGEAAVGQFVGFGLRQFAQFQLREDVE